MSELTKQLMDELGGGGFVASDYLGPATPELLNAYTPAPDAQQGGNHFAEIVNRYYSVAARLANLFDGRVYKDSTDTDLQFSVSAFDVYLGGVLCSFAGAINLGPLSGGATNHVWVDLSAAPTVAIAFGAALPATVPFIPLEAIAAPASGPWKDAHRTKITRRRSIVPTYGVTRLTIRKPFNWNDSSPVILGTVPAGGDVVRPIVYIGPAFDGTAPALTIGDDGDNSRIMAAGDIDEKTVGSYGKDVVVPYAAETVVKLYATPDTSAVGSGVAIMDVLI